LLRITYLQQRTHKLFFSQISSQKNEHGKHVLKYFDSGKNY